MPSLDWQYRSTFQSGVTCQEYDIRVDLLGRRSHGSKGGMCLLTTEIIGLLAHADYLSAPAPERELVLLPPRSTSKPPVITLASSLLLNLIN